MKECLFCKIAKHQKEADIVFEDNEIIAFKDINPKSPVHILIIPKKHIGSVKDVADSDHSLVSKIIIAAKNIATDKKLSGYKLLFNVGRDGGQIIDHIHLHLLG